MANKNKTSFKQFQLMGFLPESINFGNLKSVEEDEVVDFDAGDNGEQANTIYGKVQADFMLLQLMIQLDDKQKVILLYQILRDNGYNLNHADCAKTLSLSRENYMLYLKQVKVRCKKILKNTDDSYKDAYFEP